LNLIKADISGKSSSYYLAQANLTLRRTTSPALWISAAVLLMVYVLIAFEWVHRTLAALLGATLLLGITYLVGPFFPEFRIITFEAATRAVDLNVILLLFAMMIIVGVSEKSGMFQWLAFRCFLLAGGRAGVLAAALMLVTGVTSAFLDNVTTMLLVIPVSLRIAATLKINPVALLLPEVFASNIGGTATLIGDPPNIMIGSYAGLTFVDFLSNLLLPCTAILVISMVYFRLYFRKDLAPAPHGPGSGPARSKVLDYRIADPRVLILSLIFLAMTILLFVLQGMLDMAPCIAALIGATGLLLTSRVDIIEILEDKIEWPTLIFFAMLLSIAVCSLWLLWVR
jgi:Na+/H+ antiporter NhaD/arsenite permease-like protein